jgi:hypothetical protein
MDLLYILDQYMSKYVQAETSRINEFSGDILGDVTDLYAEVNADRVVVGLAPLKLPDHYMIDLDER